MNEFAYEMWNFKQSELLQKATKSNIFLYWKDQDRKFPWKDVLKSCVSCQQMGNCFVLWINVIRKWLISWVYAICSHQNPDIKVKLWKAKSCKNDICSNCMICQQSPESDFSQGHAIIISSYQLIVKSVVKNIQTSAMTHWPNGERSVQNDKVWIPFRPKFFKIRLRF